MGKIFNQLGSNAVVVALLALPFGLWNYELATMVTYWMLFTGAICLLAAAALSRFSRAGTVGVGLAAKVLHDIDIRMPAERCKKYGDLVQRLAVAFNERHSATPALKELTAELAKAEDIFNKLLEKHPGATQITVSTSLVNTAATATIVVSRSDYGFLAYFNQGLLCMEPLSSNVFALDAFIKAGSVNLSDSK